MILVELHGYQLTLDADDVDHVTSRHWALSRDKSGQPRFYTSVKRRMVSLERFICGDVPAGRAVTHANANRLDFRKENLLLVKPGSQRRDLTRLRAAPKNNSKRSKTGYHGVTAVRGRWRARIRTPEKLLSLGVFDSPEEAARAFDDARARLLNLPPINFPEAEE